jgi:hypothetical protein
MGHLTIPIAAAPAQTGGSSVLNLAWTVADLLDLIRRQRAQTREAHHRIAA